MKRSEYLDSMPVQEGHYSRYLNLHLSSPYGLMALSNFFHPTAYHDKFHKLPTLLIFPKIKKNVYEEISSKRKLFTATTLSRAATANMSAQETTFGHKASTLDLIVSMMLNPRAELALGPAVFSPTKPEVELSSNRTEPSHP